MTVENTAWWHLRNHQKQCDPEGIEVQVSRQALDETLDAIERKDAEIARLRGALQELENSSRGQDELSYKSYVNEVCKEALADTESKDKDHDTD